ncbi:MAG: GWxTD domain-containing protein [candidate division Zixibacteria bacterium]|nr:GWxTD domain-containing protein [candidate division Zixibacteria bacterium]
MTKADSRKWHLIVGWVIVLALLGSILPISPAQAQVAEFSGLPAPGVPVFDADLAAFRISPDSARLEIYYRITNPKLSYIKRDSEFVASYEVTAVLTGRGERQFDAVSNRENYVLPSYEETRRSTGYLINVLTVNVPEGDYEVDVTLNDRISGGSHTVTREIDLRTLGSGEWVIGGPEFFVPGAKAPDRDRYKKDTLAFVPNVTRSFTGNKTRLAFYLEVYQTAKDPITAVIMDVSQRSPKVELRDTLEIDPSQSTSAIVYTNPLEDFRTGECLLVLTPVDADGEQVVERTERIFFVEWALETLVRNDWENAVDMLIHIATKDEMDELRATPVEQRAEAFEEFWESRDPSPETQQNEWREEYYRRIRFANQQFSSAFRPGWRTDFGTVYITYGEPDEIERFPFELGQKPHEIWYYYAQRRQFLFVDVRGNGEYELQYPYDGVIR